jgi:predicted ATPase/DNA-binding winged helix-turn-helix (wHTH) protein
MMSATANHQAAQALLFGPFALFPAQLLLLQEGRPVRLGSRALEILTILAGQAGELVTKEELVERVWPGVFVDEGSLRFQMAGLRKALGDGQAGLRYVATIPGRGYQFVASVTSGTSERSPPASAKLATPGNLPVQLTQLVGRADSILVVCGRLRQRRLITIVGPGGIGKTSFTLAIADRLAETYPDGVFLLDLAPLTDPTLLSSMLVSVLGLAVASEDLMTGAIEALRSKRILLILDSCEHLVEPAAEFAERLLRGAPQLHILATSREPLSAEGESVYRLPPLQTPPVSAGMNAASALAFSAVQLFVGRARLNDETFEFDDDEALFVCEICRKLDGMALAIELAAGRVASLGIRALAAHLDDRFRLLMRGRRTAMPRHQTLEAALDWSYQFLPETDRSILRRLAIFVGGFSLEAATAVTGGPGANAAEIAGRVSDLVMKSLIAVDVSGSLSYYRLLDTTRVYALEKLIESGEHDAVARLHAEYYIGLLARAGTEAGELPLEEWLSTYGRQIDNVRKALDWAFSDSGDAALGLALTVGALPLWMHYSLMNECRIRVEAALSNEGRDPRRDMQLYHALGAVLLNVEASAGAIESALTRALEIAERLQDNDYLLRIIWCLWCHALNLGAFREGLDLARRFSDLAALSPDPVDALTGVRMRGFVLHFLGDQSGARRDIEYMISRYVIPVHRAHIVRFQFDQLVTARSKLVQILWLQGFVDQARAMIEENIADACELDHTMTLCNALTKGACPFTLISGDLPAAGRFIDMLLDRSGRNGLTIWHDWATCFKGIHLIKSGSVTEGLTLLEKTLARIPKNRFSLRYAWVIAEQADGLRRVGRIPQGLELIDQALSLSAQDEERWCVCELLRIKAELLMAQGGARALEAAEHCLVESLDWARKQGALSWELRTTLSLYRLQASRGRPADAISGLKTVFARFDQGFGTTDLLEASKILESSARD